MKLNHSLMDNNLTKSDMHSVSKLIKKKDIILTQSKKVKEFEKKWSKWLGVRYSTFVSSGSSANYISISILKVLNKNKYKNEIIVPTLTWISDISSILLNGFKPIFVDINLENLSMDIDQVLKKINKKTLGIFITHAQGFNGLNDKLLKAINKHKLYLIEDVCESHGATYKNKKLGTFGLMSNFSFYYAHHMTTIEGGMICTNDEELYQTFRMLRSHGLVREASSETFRNSYIDQYADLNPQFIFSFPAYNVRNTEIGGILGRSQLKKLDQNNIKRNENNFLFLSKINSERFQTNFRLEGSSNYAFNLVTKTADFNFTEKLMDKLNTEKIEFRRGSAGGGNQLRQPYLKSLFGDLYRDFPKVDHIHFHGFYIGNFPSLEKNKIEKLCEIINSV